MGMVASALVMRKLERLIRSSLEEAVAAASRGKETRTQRPIKMTA